MLRYGTARFNDRTGMTAARTTTLVLAILFSASSLPAQDKPPNGLILKVEETSSGPFGGQRSSSCLRVYSGGRVIFASWWTSAATIIDSATKKTSSPEHTVSVEYQLDDTDLWELSNFIQSKTVRKLPEVFGPPHRPVDYIEAVTVDIFGTKGSPKRISTREYYVADLEEKSRYPSALILLMEKINQIEETASKKGKPTDIPADCTLKQYEH